MSTPLLNQNTIVSPLITEKTYQLAAMDKYVFRVHPLASKYQIKQAIKDLFQVDVVGINTVRSRARKVKSMKTGKYKSIPVNKKAIVQIKKGQKIEIFSMLKS
jgi:large subunit ribosomal protein L23